MSLTSIGRKHLYKDGNNCIKSFVIKKKKGCYLILGLHLCMNHVSKTEKRLLSDLGCTFTLLDNF